MQLCVAEGDRALMTVKRSRFHSGLCQVFAVRASVTNLPLPIRQNERLSSEVAGSSVSSVGIERGCPKPPPYNLEDGGFSQASFAWDAGALGRSRGQFGPAEAIATHTHGPRAQHPLVALAGNVVGNPDHSSHPTCLPTPGPHHLTTSPQGSSPEEEEAAGD